ncbi:MAG: hypothetical protein O3A00_26050 [Planctomycetota bacterium]|nr:hypothetical protein [Planctomycetota bacterium]
MTSSASLGPHERSNSLHRDESGFETIQCVMILAFAAMIMLGVLTLWGGSDGEGGIKGEVVAKYDELLNDGESCGVPPGDGDSPVGSGPGGDAGDDETGGGGDGESGGENSGEITPPDPGDPSDRERQIKFLEDSIRFTERAQRTATLIGDHVHAQQLKIAADAFKMDLARLKGTDYLKSQIKAIAARRTVTTIAEVLLEAAEKRLPIAKWVKAPILDGAGQLTEEFVGWWDGVKKWSWTAG